MPVAVGKHASEWGPQAPAQFAGIVWRALALIADVFVLVAWIAGLQGLASGALANAVLPAVGAAGLLVYFPLAWGRFGRTFGMVLLGLRVVRAGDGGPIGYAVAFRRFLVFLPCVCLAFVVVGLVFVVPVIIDRRRRALHDRLAGTLVLRVPYSGASPWWWGPWCC
jgi:uncharacterized RDD family membrane protein YckC